MGLPEFPTPSCRCTQVSSCLYHKSWETRVAAGEAIGLLAEAFTHPTAQDLAEHCIACGGATAEELAALSGCVATFQEFNLKHVLERGQALLASGGQVCVGGGVGGQVWG